MPFLKTLGEIETRFTELENHDTASKTAKKIVLASIRKAYFDKCIGANCKIMSGDASSKGVLETYKGWIGSMNQILINRKNTLLNKQINLFTTNMDIFPEMALESLGVEYNDGFYGTMSPIFDLSNFKKSILKTSQQYGVAAELPMFNLYKLHGSVTWRMDAAEFIRFDHNLMATDTLNKLPVDPSQLVDVFIAGTSNLKSIDDLVGEAAGIRSSRQAGKINQAYEKLMIVNPTKEKFRLTTLNRTYYELLRMYSNELERENTILFVMGFSFADEHISEITLRAARSNPTLKINVFAFNEAGEADIKRNLGLTNPTGKQANIQFVPREKIKDPASGAVTGEVSHDLKSVNEKVFAALARDTSGSK